ncbi:MAG: cadmium-translocating P-type ATPase [Verrucomicrobiales bacterium]|nr:cadmium-translocating P-type ATPase [Verrucomicrobiales bacterium]
MPGNPHPSPRSDRCFVRLVADEMQSDPRLEAVKVDRKTQAISVATLGETQGGAAADRVAGLLKSSDLGHDPDHVCALLSGADDCAGCPHSTQWSASKKLTIDHAPEVTTIARVTCPTAPRFWLWRERPLPRFVPREVRLPEDDHDEDEWKPQLAAAGLCAVAGIAGWLLPDGALQGWVFLLAYISGGWFPAAEVWERLRERQLDVHFLMLAVAAGAAAIGSWGEGAALLFLFSLSGALEHYAMGRTHREIRSLIHAAPKEATQLREDGSEHRVPIASLTRGMRLLVRPAELFPVDAEILRGDTAADESNLTGESAPVDKRVGDMVLGGTLNLWGAVEVTVKQPAEESALQRIIRLIYESQRLKAPSQRFTDRFGTAYTLGILGLTTVMFLFWWLVRDLPPWVGTSGRPSAFYRAMTLLVVASPCALVLSIPSAILAAIAHGARHGVLFRGGAAVEKLASVDVVAMDKTGTLTTGELRVESVESLPPGREAEVLRAAYSVERLSTHPLARAITRHGKRLGLSAEPVHAVESVPGLGLSARVDNQELRVGRRDFVIRNEGKDAEKAALQSISEQGVSEVWVSGGDFTGRVLLRDDIRPQARDVVAALRKSGLRTLVLTGDRRAAGEYLQSRLAVDEVRSELKPEQKVAAIAELTREGRKVAMIGDGVNDAPALAAAQVGVAMGARGSDAALEQADVVLMHDRLENFQRAHRLSQRACRVIRQNLVISLGTLVVLAVLAAMAKVPLSQGVLGHEGSTVLVVLNSLRLLFSERRA